MRIRIEFEVGESRWTVERVSEDYRHLDGEWAGSNPAGLLANAVADMERASGITVPR